MDGESRLDYPRAPEGYKRDREPHFSQHFERRKLTRQRRPRHKLLLWSLSATTALAELFSCAEHYKTPEYIDFGMEIRSELDSDISFDIPCVIEAAEEEQ